MRAFTNKANAGHLICMIYLRALPPQKIAPLNTTYKKVGNGTSYQVPSVVYFFPRVPKTAVQLFATDNQKSGRLPWHFESSDDCHSEPFISTTCLQCR